MGRTIVAKCFGWLWTQEAAGWAQAVFTFIAIVATYLLSSATTRREEKQRMEARRTQARSRSLALLPAITEWDSKLSALAPDRPRQRISPSEFKDAIAPPARLVDAVEFFYTLGDPGQVLERAIFLGDWLIDHRDGVEGQFHDSGEDSEKIRARAAFWLRVDRLRIEVLAAKETIRATFADELGLPRFNTAPS